MELADQQNSENEGVVSGAEIPAGSPETASSAASSSSAPEKPLSIREQLTKSIESVRTEEAKRARAADGKFTRLEGAAETPATNETQKTPAETPTAASTAAEPPSAWKGIWEKLPEEARAIAVKRETEVAKGFDEYRGKVKQYDAIEQVLAPARARFQQQGIANDADALRNIISWEQGLSDPATRVTAFRDLARQLGVDLSTLAQSSSQAPSQVQDVPEPLRPVIDQFGNIVQEVNSLKAQLQRGQEEKISSELSAFAKDKPHFEKVRVIMGQLMNAGIVSPGDLEGAYQKATQLHPEVSAQIEADKAARAAAELARSQAEKASNARRAAVSPPGRSPNGATQVTTNKGTGVRGSILASVAALRDEQRA